MNDAQKGIVLTKQAAQITGEVLRDMFKTFLESKSVKKGEIKISELAKTGKLESIEITENNIADFRDVAKHYDIDFALKRDASTTPPTYHVFFATEKTENFKRAFTEYAAKVSQKRDTSKEFSVTREQLHRNAKTVAQTHDDKKQEKERTLQKNQNMTR